MVALNRLEDVPTHSLRQNAFSTLHGRRRRVRGRTSLSKNLFSNVNFMTEPDIPQLSIFKPWQRFKALRPFQSFRRASRPRKMPAPACNSASPPSTCQTMVDGPWTGLPLLSRSCSISAGTRRRSLREWKCTRMVASDAAVTLSRSWRWVRAPWGWDEALSLPTFGARQVFRG